MSAVEKIKDSRAKVGAIVESLKELPQVDCPVTHRFSPGCYLREIFMPKGSVVIGKIHATEHFNIVLSGEVTVITVGSDGEFVRERIKAPHTFVSGAGVQKVVVMHEDCQWQTIHVTDETDLELIEKSVIVESHDNLAIDSMLDEARGLL